MPRSVQAFTQNATVTNSPSNVNNGDPTQAIDESSSVFKIPSFLDVCNPVTQNGQNPFMAGLNTMGDGANTTGVSGQTGNMLSGFQTFVDSLCGFALGGTSTHEVLEAARNLRRQGGDLHLTLEALRRLRDTVGAGTTPQTVLAGVEAVNTAANANPMVSDAIARGRAEGSTGNQALDGLNGAQSLANDGSTILTGREVSGDGVGANDLLGQGGNVFSNLFLGILGFHKGDAPKDLTADPSTFDGSSADYRGIVGGERVTRDLRPQAAPIVSAAHISAVNPELLWDPGFDSADTIVPLAPHITWDGTTGRTANGSLLIQPDGNYVYSNVSNPIPLTNDHEVSVSIWCKWSGITYTGTTPIQLHILEASAVNGVEQRMGSFQVAAFTSPPTNQSTWQELSLSGYVASSGAIDTIYLRPVVDISCTAGSVWFDDGSAKKINALPSSVLANIPVDVVDGIQGISDIGTVSQVFWDNTANAIATALGLSGVSGSDNSLSTVTSTLQSHAQLTNTAATQSAANTNTLAIVDNRSTAAGLEATVESNMSLQSLGSGSTPSTIAVTQAVSGGAFLRIAQAKVLGFLQWWGSSSGTITHFYLNFYQMDSSGNLDLLFSSSDLTTSLSGTGKWNVYVFSSTNEIAVQPGDVIAVEAQVVGGGTVTMAGLGQSWQTNHPTANILRTGFTDNWGTSAASTISSGSIVPTGNTPYIGLGVSNVPPGYQPPETMPYGAHGTYTYTIPTAFRVTGYKIDRIVLGAGAGGGGGTGLTTGRGGGAGSWATDTLVIGTDIPLTTTTLTVTVGTGGAGGPAENTGSNGTSSSVSGTGATTLTGAGGAINASSSPNGLGPGNQVWDGLTYTGGTVVSNPSAGSSPGGGGSGGQKRAAGAAGADGSVWIVARQS